MTEPAFDLITLGEGMVQLSAQTTGPLRHVQSYEAHPAGSELNVAIGAARLGLRVGWISRVGADGFGDLLVAAARAELVDTSHVTRDADAPTGVFFVQRGYPDGQSSSIYYRNGSAGSLLSAADVDRGYIAGAAFFHTSGISLAASADLHAAARTAIAAASDAGARLSFDVNFRAKLWSADEARPVLERALAASDVAFCSLADARAVWAVPDADAALELVSSFGPAHVVVSCGPEGAIMAGPDGAVVRSPAFPTQVVDPTGAGDAFCATVLTGLSRGWPAEMLLQRACLVGSMVCGVFGDTEGVPSLHDLELTATDSWVHR
jgi:sugar/nucleoside kinase (ribokinase family)